MVNPRNLFVYFVTHLARVSSTRSCSRSQAVGVVDGERKVAKGQMGGETEKTDSVSLMMLEDWGMQNNTFLALVLDSV